MAAEWVSDLARRGEIDPAYAEGLVEQNREINSAQENVRGMNRKPVRVNSSGLYPRYSQDVNWPMTDKFQAFSLSANRKHEMLDEDDLYDREMLKMADGDNTRYQNLQKGSKEWEEMRPYPYLDSTNNRTIGWGTNIQSPRKRKTVRWNNGVSDEDADREMRINIDPLAGKNLQAKAFRKKSNLRISPEEADRLYNIDYQVAVDDARKEIPEFDNLHPFLQKPIVDMTYNLGATKFRDYVNFRRAIEEGRYADAAAESSRRNIQADRNNWTRDHLLMFERFLKERQRQQNLLQKMKYGVDMPYLPQDVYWLREE